MGKYITIFGGIMSISIGLWGVVTWWESIVVLLQGAVSPVLVVGGLAALFAGVNELKDSKKKKK